MKEHKIGEIFEFGGEWYQCMKGNTCNDCAFYRSSCGSLNGKGSCSYNFRKDATNVIFKKLKKVGESPCKSCYFGMVQLYKLPYWNNGMVEPVGCHFTGDGYVLIEIKQRRYGTRNRIFWR